MPKGEVSQAVLDTLTAATASLEKARKPTAWRFDPQRAVDLLFGAEPKFQFERAVSLYLFLLWCLKPGSVAQPNSMRSVAASAALQITFLGTQSSTGLQGKHFKDIASLRKRLDCDWYHGFYTLFIKPIGGLHHAIHAPSRRSEDRLLLERYQELSRELAIIDLIACAITSAPHLNTRANIRRAFQSDVLCLGGSFYKHTKVKRSGAQEQAKERGEVVRYLNDTTFDELWDGAPQTIVLLYVLKTVFAKSKIEFASNDILSRLDCDKPLLDSLRNAIGLYSTIVTDFATLAGSKLVVQAGPSGLASTQMNPKWASGT